MLSLAFTGKAAPLTSADTADMVSQAAINDAAGKIAGALNLAASGPSSENKAVEAPTVSHGGGGVLLALLGGALLYAIFHKGSSSGSNSTATASGNGGGGSGTGTGTGGGSGVGGNPPPAPPI